MSLYSVALGIMIILLSIRPSVARASRMIRTTRRAMTELHARQRALSNRIRILARESLSQRLTAGQDANESDQAEKRIAALQREVERLEAEDRRILVIDERRGLQETGWILCIRRVPAAASPLEPVHITSLWDEGRYVFFFAADMQRARRKALLRFSEDAGFLIIDAKPHEGDLAEPPMLSQRQAKP
ncbi:hypothetical protein [Niveispirillum irakense]|uniref:hypothetical protein n=1 Tax=Niveispirillum irakense TaxID=34011 RepID=UPI00048C16C0|nr:hypothetical protein [Niveispirillum irakense]